MKKLITILFALLCIQCFQFEEINDISAIISISSKDNILTMPADNKTTLKITAFISIASDTDKRDIEFFTSSGVFTENAKQSFVKNAKDTIEVNGTKFLSSTVTLKSNNIISDNVKVTAKILQVPASINIIFTESQPKKLKLSSNVFGIDNTFTSEAIFTANVTSDTGYPSSGHEVEFLVFNASNDSQFKEARFREENLKLNGTGQASTKFTAGNLNLGGNKFEGDLKIVARLKNNPEITDTIIFNVFKIN